MPKNKIDKNLDFILNSNNISSDIVDLSPGLFRARRSFDEEIIDYVNQEINKIELYHDINKIISNPNLDSYLIKILNDSRAALAALLAKDMQNRTLIEQCDRLKVLASRDQMTKLWNKDSFDEYVKNVFEFKKNMQTFSFVFSDIDHFKKINDTYGHDAGDRVIELIGTIINNSMRTFDIGARDLNVNKNFVNLNKSQNKAFRAGGEEFCFILHGTNEYGASCFADRLRKNIANYKFVYGDIVIPVTMSFGVTECTDYDSIFDPIKKRGDKALYHSKGNGRNKVSVARIDDKQNISYNIFEK